MNRISSGLQKTILKLIYYVFKFIYQMIKDHLDGKK